MWGCHALMHFYRVLSWKWLSAPIAQFQLIYSLRWTSCTLIPFGAKQSLKKRLLMPAYYGLRFALEASFKWHLQNWCQGNQMSVTLVNSPVVASFWPDIFYCDVIHWMPYLCISRACPRCWLGPTDPFSKPAPLPWWMSSALRSSTQSHC